MKKLRVINPATEEVLKELPVADKKEVHSKVSLARSAQKDWRLLPYNKRARYLRRFNSLVKENRISIARMIHLEMGKPMHEALSEVERAIENTIWFIKNVDKELKPKRMPGNALLVKEPIGIVAAITPWNLPFMIPLWIIPPALLAGNTVVFKPSELSPLVGMKIVELFSRAGLPNGCLNLLLGAGAVGKELVKSDVGMVAFVGSQKAGKAVMKNASYKLHKLALELGGKDPLIVCNDADLKKAAKDTVKGALLNCGQLCASVERIYIEKNAYAPFLASVLREVKSYGELGPLSNRTLLKTVRSHLNDALRKGAKILLGGKKILGKGYYFEPTVIVGVDHSMKIMNEETSGPIVAIMKVDDVNQAIRLSNSLHFGLCASIYSKNKRKAKKIAGQLQAGTVCINCTPKSRAALPWGGVKQSGFGRMLSQQGINEFLETKAIQFS
ncbi:MAG: aldehyde dehydrogenase family protein [Candidatus Diapherotrites archaeon]|nr:aldehyde dehydrogenase family protein [Candidatus Diapherotrites archaeon]